MVRLLKNAPDIFAVFRYLFRVKNFFFFNFQEEKKSLKERLQAIQEVTATVQNAIGAIASLFESINK